MIIDMEGNPISASGAPSRASWGMKLAWLASFLTLLVGAAAAMAFAVWVALILVPLGLATTAIAAIYYRIRLSRLRKAAIIRP